MSRDVVRVSPEAIRWKLSINLAQHRRAHAELMGMERHPVTETDKYRSIVMRFVDQSPWEETPLFRIYRERVADGDSPRGCSTMQALKVNYYTRVDAMFADLREHGWRDVAEGQVTSPIPVYLAHDNVLVMGNQGNHRLAMAQILKLDRVTVDIVGRHPDSTRADFEVAPTVMPDLPESARDIPAMTTEAERCCYYRLTLQQSRVGAVVELGAWLGAATAYIAAGMRDSTSPGRVQVFDRFVWKPASHDKKAGGPLKMSQRQAFERNLGPLLKYVDVHAGDLSGLKWRGGLVSLLICDAPKRIAEISRVLTVFGDAMKAGAIMAWQDFAYFPSYDIPAALMTLGDHVEFVEAVYPGTTAVFRVVKPWSGKSVSTSSLDLKRWTPDMVEASWDAWTSRLPESMRPRFSCGAAMFLCDLGATDRAQRRLESIVEAHPDEVLPKWRYLIAERARLMQRYQPLVEVVERCA